MFISKKILLSVVVLAGLTIAILGVSYLSGVLFFYINKMPIEGNVTPVTIWQYFLAYKNSLSRFVKITVFICTLAPYLILLLACLVVFQTKPMSLHGDARFATLAEIKKPGLIEPPNGLSQTILVGKYKGHYRTYGGTQFVLLAAPTRSGKGVGIVIPNCLNYSDSLVVLDIKLENFTITSGFRTKYGQEVYLFSPFAPQGRTHRYNPIEYISTDPADRIGDIDSIAAALYTSSDEKDKFWTENAKDLFRGLCLLVLETTQIAKNSRRNP